MQTLQSLKARHPTRLGWNIEAVFMSFVGAQVTSNNWKINLLFRN